MSDPLTDFIAACRVEIERAPDAADRVVAIAPLMAELAAMAPPGSRAQTQRPGALRPQCHPY